MCCAYIEYQAFHTVFFYLFVLGFNVSLTLVQSYRDGACMRQIRVLQHWNAPVAGTWQEHPYQSYYKLTPGRPAIFSSTHLSMLSVSKGATGTIFLRLLICRGWGSNPQPTVPQAHALPLKHRAGFTQVVAKNRLQVASYADMSSWSLLNFWPV